MHKRLFTAAAIVAIAAAACTSAGSGLTGKTWQLVAITTKVPAFQGVVPADQQADYTIEFKTDGTFGAKADCNQLAGTYTTTSSGGLTIQLGPSTLAACPEGSLDTEYVTALGMAKSYAIANNALTITTTDEGTLEFK
jgi:heat shock protein HslJ